MYKSGSTKKSSRTEDTRQAAKCSPNGERERGLVEVETFFEISIRILPSRDHLANCAKRGEKFIVKSSCPIPSSLGTIIVIINARAVRLCREKTRDDSVAQ